MWIGASLGDLNGAIAGAVFAIILHAYSFKELELRREQEIAHAKDDVQTCKDDLKEEESRPEIFSYAEEISGEPDQKS